MENFFKWLDETAAITQDGATAKWLERLAFIALMLLVLAAPHSIAATQTAWVLGLVLWIARFLAKPSISFLKTPLNLAIFAFIGWSIVSAIFSYAPDISIDRLRNVSLIMIFFFVFSNLRTKKAAIFLASALILSCMVNVVWTPVQRLIGRGVQIEGLEPSSLIAKGKMKDGSILVDAHLRDGDSVLEANNKKIGTPEELLAEVERNDVTPLKVYSYDFYRTVFVNRSDLLEGTTALEKLGTQSLKTSRSWRSQGFYNHFTTYAEVLQLILSLFFGFFVAYGNWRSRHGILMFICIGLMGLALLLTGTRASQAAFLLSALVIAFFGLSRKLFIGLVLVAIPVAIAGLIFLQQTRKVGFYDTSDNSITWRQTVYKEGFNLVTESPRHLAVGVGMDSIKRYAKDWHLFDDGRLHMGHFHSTLLQIAVERGIPALVFWLLILAIYAKTLIKPIKKNGFADWREKGIVLGCMGGMVGFFTSGIVHYNLGDGEVAMVFYLLMGISVYLASKTEKQVA